MKKYDDIVKTECCEWCGTYVKIKRWRKSFYPHLRKVYTDMGNYNVCGKCFSYMAIFDALPFKFKK